MNRSICHITHIENLPAILEANGLWCDREADQRGLVKQSIAHHHIKERRARRAVSAGPGGFLCDYVPFYFHPRSPMLYAIHMGGVSGYSGGQQDVVCLISTTDYVQESGLSFVFTDGHAVIALSQQYQDLSDLDKIDWEAVRSSYWKDTDEYPDRERRKQAEFLVHRFFPLECIASIGVLNMTVQEGVTQILGERAPILPVQTRPTWYY